MSCTVTQFLDKCAEYIGIPEQGIKHTQLIDTYNSKATGYKMRYIDAWCMAGLSAIAIMTNSTDIIPISCNCAQEIGNFKKMDVWYDGYDTSKMLKGDIVFYDWNNDGVSDHVGIVKGVYMWGAVILEFNKNDTVGYRYVYNNRYNCVIGYARPKYTTCGKTPLEILKTAQNVIDGKYGNGDIRTHKLTELGYNATQIQDIINIAYKTY